MIIRKHKVKKSIVFLLLVISSVPIAILAIYFTYLEYEVDIEKYVDQEKYSVNYSRISGTQAQEDSLLIPTLGMDEQLHFGRDEKLLEKGVWLKQQFALPEQTGNIVITGHRNNGLFRKGVFYDLHRLKKGNEIVLIWQGKVYEYRISNTKIVSETEVGIETKAFTKNPQRLVIYTCHGIKAEQRFVVFAERTN